MKRFLYFAFFILVACTAFTPAHTKNYGFDEALTNAIQDLKETTRSEIKDGLEYGLYKGFTNAAFKGGGVGFALLSCYYCLWPEFCAFLDASNKQNEDQSQSRPAYPWNYYKLAAGAIGVVAGLTLAIKADSLTSYLYTKSI